MEKESRMLKEQKFLPGPQAGGTGETQSLEMVGLEIGGWPMSQIWAASCFCKLNVIGKHLCPLMYPLSIISFM